MRTQQRRCAGRANPITVAAMSDGCPVRWTGRQAIVTLPQHADEFDVGRMREELLPVINRGAPELVVGR